MRKIVVSTWVIEKGEGVFEKTDLSDDATECGLAIYRFNIMVNFDHRAQFNIPIEFMERPSLESIRRRD